MSLGEAEIRQRLRLTLLESSAHPGGDLRLFEQHNQ
jgi:hypothetical protein